MTVLTIASSKGGSGKTAVSQLICGVLAAQGSRVVALDADPTAALSRWAAQIYEGPPFACVAELDETRLAHLIDRHAGEADIVVLDTAGFGNRGASIAMTASDAVLVPCLPGEADVTEAEKTVRLAGGLGKAARRDIPVRVVLNRVKRTGLARHALAEMERAGLPRLEATLSDLVAYGEMTFSGRVPVSGTAGNEVSALVAELRRIGWLPERRQAELDTERRDVTT